jgi:hypothetical protein
MDIEATIGRRLDTMAKGVQGLQDQLAATAEERARLRGIKFIRLAVVRGTASGSALTMGGDTGQAFTTPEQGYVWSVRHLVVEGMATGATPDVVNILRAGRIIWQLNGNQFAQTWGRGEILLNAGETLTYQSVGTFNSTAQIIAHGTALETPGEFAGKLGA